MSNKPKQWGPHASPEGLGKLRTAIATLPGQSHVSVSGPGFTGKKAGDYREVTSYEPPEKRESLLSEFGEVIVTQRASFDSGAYNTDVYAPDGFVGDNPLWGLSLRDKDFSVKKHVSQEDFAPVGIHNWFSKNEANSPLITYPSAYEPRLSYPIAIPVIEQTNDGSVHLNGNQVLCFGGEFDRDGKHYDHRLLSDWACLCAWYKKVDGVYRCYVAMCRRSDPRSVSVIRQSKGSSFCDGWELYAEGEGLIPGGHSFVRGREVIAAGSTYNYGSQCSTPICANWTGTKFAGVACRTHRHGILVEVSIVKEGPKPYRLISKVILDAISPVDYLKAFCYSKKTNELQWVGQILRSYSLPYPQSGGVSYSLLYSDGYQQDYLSTGDLGMPFTRVQMGPVFWDMRHNLVVMNWNHLESATQSITAHISERAVFKYKANVVGERWMDSMVVDSVGRLGGGGGWGSTSRDGKSVIFFPYLSVYPMDRLFWTQEYGDSKFGFADSFSYAAFYRPKRMTEKIKIYS